MKLKLFAFLLFALCSQTHSAIFDFVKAKSKLEKFICANQSIDQADKKMGETFLEARKKITLKGYINADQKYWLKDEYNSCGSRTDKTLNELVASCLEILDKRISDLNLMKTSEI